MNRDARESFSAFKKQHGPYSADYLLMQVAALTELMREYVDALGAAAPLVALAFCDEMVEIVGNESCPHAQRGVVDELSERRENRRRAKD